MQLSKKASKLLQERPELTPSAFIISMTEPEPILYINCKNGFKIFKLAEYPGIRLLTVNSLVKGFGTFPIFKIG